MHWYEFIIRLVCAVAAGSLIGLERQWRSRGADLRTNTLVAAGAAMFVLIAQMTPHDASPTRITSYVVSGVGFLGAGVILSDGASIRGINTAATLWCAAAAGALSASGFLWQAGVVTVAVLSINIFLRPLGRRIDRQPIDAATEIETAYRFRITTRGSTRRTSARCCCKHSPAAATSFAASRAQTSTTPTA